MSDPITFRQRLARNTAASMATNVWSMVLALVSLPIVLRGLGIEAFGVWVFLQTFSATTGWLSIPAIGLATSSTRFVASGLAERQPDERRRVTASVFAVFSVSGIVFGVLLALLAPRILRAALDLSGSSLDSLTLVGVAFGFQVLAEHVCLAITSSIEGEQDVALARMIDAARKTAMAAAISVVALSHGTLVSVAVTNALAAAGVSAVVLVVLRSRSRMEFGRPEVADMRSLVTYGTTVSALAGTGVLHRTMDRTIAGVVFGPDAVTLVEIANQVQAGVSAVLSASTYPVLSSAPMLASAGDDSALRALYERMTRYSVLLTVPVCTLVVVLADPFIRVWVGKDFSEAIGLIQIAVLYVVLAAPLQAGSNLLQGVGGAGSVLRASFVSVMINLAASLIFVEAFGLVGVFVGTIVGAIVLVPMLLGPISVSISARAQPALGRSMVAAVPSGVLGAVAAAPVLLTEWTPTVQLVIGGLCGVAVAAGVTLRWSVDEYERGELFAVLRRHSA